MKQHFYIPSFLLILFINLVYPDGNPVQGNWKGSGNKYLQIQKLTGNNWALNDATDEDLSEFVGQSFKIPLPEKTPGQKEMRPGGSLICRDALVFRILLKNSDFACPSKPGV